MPLVEAKNYLTFGAGLAIINIQTTKALFETCQSEEALVEKNQNKKGEVLWV